MTYDSVPLKAIALEAQTGPFGSQLHSDEYIDNGVPIINPSNIKNGRLVADQSSTVDAETAIRLQVHELREGDLVFARRGELGRAAVVTEIESGWLCGTGSIRVRPKQGTLDSNFGRYALQSAEVRGYFERQAVGSTMGNLNTAIVLGLPFPYPSMEKQCRIAAFLDAETDHIDRLSSLQTAVLTRLGERDDAIIDLTIDDLFKRVGPTPFRRFIMAMDQGSSPQCEAVPAEADEWGVLKVSCLRPGSFLAHQNKRIPHGVVPNTRGEVREGDLLITRANTPELVGSTAVVPAVRSKLLLSDKIFRVETSPHLDPRFVEVIAQGSRVRAMCTSSSNGASSSMANIRFEEVKEWPIPLISRAEQLKIVSEVQGIRGKTEALRIRINQQLVLLAERRQALITAAVTGQIDVSTASGRGVDVS